MTRMTVVEYYVMGNPYESYYEDFAVDNFKDAYRAFRDMWQQYVYVAISEKQGTFFKHKFKDGRAIHVIRNMWFWDIEEDEKEKTNV